MGGGVRDAQRDVDQCVQLVARSLLEDGFASSCSCARAGGNHGVDAAACLGARAWSILGRCACKDAEDNNSFIISCVVCVGG
jgi:hypothetical protein